MNINVKAGRTALMTGITLIAAIVIAACGNDTEATATSTTLTEASGKTSVAPTTASSPEYEIVIAPVDASVESFWSKMAGDKITLPEFLVGVNIEGPLYGPSAVAGDFFDAMGHVGTKCIAIFVKAMGNGEASSFGTFLYVESGDTITPWAAHDGSEANTAGANRLNAHFKKQCNA